MNKEELQKLINQLLEQSISDEDFTLLKKELKSSKESRLHYLDLCQSHSILAEKYNALIFERPPAKTVQRKVQEESHDSMNEDELQKLINQLLEQSISDEDFNILKKELKNSKASRQHYLELCQTHSVLSEKYNALIFERPAVHNKRNEKQEENHKVRIISFATMITSLAALFIAVFIIGNKQQSLSVQPELVSETPFRGEVIAKVNKAIATEFEYGGLDGQTIKPGSWLPTGSYNLKRGILEISYNNGVAAIIEAPTRFTVESDMLINCQSGRLSANVPESGKGFTVETPCASIIDLGTEFSVIVEEDEYIEAHVYKGQVRVEWTNQGDVSDKLLDAGNALRIIYQQSDNSKFVETIAAGIDLKRNFFIRNLNEPESEYSKNILALNPVLYFPMDVTEDGNIFKDWSNYKNDGTANIRKNQSTILARGKSGNALRLAGVNHKSFIHVSNYPKARFNEISVTAWVNAHSRPQWATILKNWDAFNYGQFHFGLNQLGHLDVEIQDLDGERHHITEDIPIPTGSWHHVAFVHDGTHVTLYRNGKKLTKTRINGLRVNPNINGLGIGTKLSEVDGQADKGNPGHWNGRLDEIAIFNHALTIDQVKSLNRSGRLLSKIQQEQDSQP
ncbi:hypothetical protein LNTAR_09846 [Lentisphaera araneosa HTCC2155]|uniref:LamG-like jellyroll fold domain-containing protein n=1 Tax=Lentisphaera araneosa HTCC2155 TaxID=313628 RepID=A6DSI2_9BACT|nr:LamG-like jellyroll fold domain-containing protein [Lentisphaera araneosa]EDM25427.1 hypothetical protein LNTAR_09846 [Lentisphaera araneosa HTCC2155]